MARNVARADALPIGLTSLTGGVTHMLRAYVTHIAPLERVDDAAWRKTEAVGNKVMRRLSSLLVNNYYPVLFLVVKGMAEGRGLLDAVARVEERRAAVGNFTRLLSDIPAYKQYSKADARVPARALDPARRAARRRGGGRRGAGRPSRRPRPPPPPPPFLWQVASRPRPRDVDGVGGRARGRGERRRGARYRVGGRRRGRRCLALHRELRAVLARFGRRRPPLSRRASSAPLRDRRALRQPLRGGEDGGGGGGVPASTLPQVWKKCVVPPTMGGGHADNAVRRALE